MSNSASNSPTPDPLGPLSLEAPLVRLVERLAGGRTLAERVAEARKRRWKRQVKGGKAEQATAVATTTI
jgi:hypothetical protein